MIKPRVIVLQKLYSNYMDKDQKLIYPKHRYKNFIKAIVNGTIEREEIINDLIGKILKDDLKESRTEILLKLLVMAGTYELLYRPQTSSRIIINEYLTTANFFLETKKKKFLNALLDKMAKKIRNTNG